jgi:hypothetical protein
MGELLDFSAYQARSKIGSQEPKDGLCVKAVPPFLVFRKYQGGVVRREWLILSEHLLRGMLDQFPVID